MHLEEAFQAAGYIEALREKVVMLTSITDASVRDPVKFCNENLNFTCVERFLLIIILQAGVSVESFIEIENGSFQLDSTGIRTRYFEI